MKDRARIFSEILQEASVTEGDFSTRQTVPFDDLILSVSGGSPLRFPLTKTQVRALIKQAKPAHFGLKDQTLHDKTVRDTWEIPKSRLKIDKRRWNTTLKPLLESVAVDLGLPEGASFKAELHNLLIYEEGQFFLPHQDSEKVDGMVATLIIVLPSKHKGGALVIDHGGKKRTVQTSRGKLDALSCIAFYADCHHEVKPLTEGYRVALTYNLVLKNAEAAVAQVIDEKPLVEALSAYFDDADQTNRALSEGTLRSWRSPATPKWVFLLDHQYTQKSLTAAQLKNQDRSRFQLIRKAAETLDCHINLGLIELQETWDAYAEDEIFDRYGNSLGSRSGDEEAYELNGLIDSNVSLTFVASSSTKTALPLDIEMERDQLFWITPCDAFDPFSSEYEGWMGNYGNTLERLYHRACIVLTRKIDQYAAMCETQPDLLIEKLQALAEADATRADTRAIIISILPYWPRARGHEAYKDIAWVNAVFKLTQSIKDDALALQLIRPLTLKALNPKTAKAFGLCVNHYGDLFAEQVLNEWKASNNQYGCHYLASFESFIGRLIKNKVSPKTLEWFLNYQFDTLVASFDRASRGSMVAIKDDEQDRLNDTTQFLKACVMTGNKTLVTKMINYVEAHALLFPLLVKAELLVNVKPMSLIKEYPGYLALYRSVLGGLEKAVNAPVRQKDDWSIRDKVDCDCHLCKTLTGFLIDAEQQSMLWPLAEAQRQHIHSIIKSMGLPVTHVTKREGRPYKLFLKKTQELHINAKNQRKAEEQAFKKITALVVD